MRLTKTAVIAANDDIQNVIGFEPPLNTKLKADELNKELHQKILDVEIDADDREDLKKETCAVIDALAAKFADGNGEEKEETSDKVSKKSGKKSTNKSKKEAIEEKPVKKAKVKKGKVDPLVLAEEIKTNKKINRDGLYAIVNDNTNLFGDASGTLLSITNPMVLKKQMRNVLEGGKVEMTKTKAPVRKPKEVKPTLRESVDAAEDLEVLKSIAKENKEAFPGVKVKKFDKLKKLRKAMLAVIVEKKKKAASRSLSEVKEERQKRIDFITKTLDAAGGSMGRKKLTALTITEFPEPEKAIRDLISYAKNPKYNKFTKLMVEVDGIIGWEDVVTATKGPKKEEKKDKKKNKKSKKGKK